VEATVTVSFSGNYRQVAIIDKMNVVFMLIYRICPFLFVLFGLISTVYDN
jgi:hypothetical protein